LYGIIQGGVYKDLRRESVEFTNSQPFFGTAIGGSLGANTATMHDIVAYTRDLVRDDRPVHLLGIGGVIDIFHGVRQGIDTFDCVHPTRLARHGGALVKASHWDDIPTYIDEVTAVSSNKKRAKAPPEGTLWEPGSIEERTWKKQRNIDRRAARQLIEKRTGLQKIRPHISLPKSPFTEDPRPIDANCQCYTCKNFSRSYLHHLFKTDEILGPMLVTTHNIHFMNAMMKDIRHGIETDTLDEVEKVYVHPSLKNNVKNDGIETSDT
jgi:queuine tRNA-ribosyltransferase